MQRRLVLLVALLVCLPAVAHASFTIDVPEVILLPNMAGQDVIVSITATGGDTIQSVDIFNWVGDGSSTGPIITAISWADAGYLFAGDGGGIYAAPNNLGSRRASFASAAANPFVPSAGLGQPDASHVRHHGCRIGSGHLSLGFVHQPSEQHNRIEPKG